MRTAYETADTGTMHTHAGTLGTNQGLFIS